MSHALFCHHYLMAACQRLHHLSPAREEAHQEAMAVGVTLNSVVVGEEDATTIGDRSTTDGPVEAFHQENGGEVKHRRNVSLVMEEEEGEGQLVLAGQRAIGTGEEGDVGDP